jgi:DNA-binding LacI/PurR family transcriptional regulator
VLSPRRLHRDLDALGSKQAVFVNRQVAGRPAVLLRAAAATGEALRHLASLGHTRLAYLAGPKGSWAASERRTAVRRTSRSAGMDVVDIAVGDPTFEAAAEAAAGVPGTGATAVVAFNDQMALGVMAALARLGVAVPDEVSVVGCDDVPMAAMVAPPLTTIRMPTEEAGAAAVALLDGDPSATELFGTLVVRDSTGPVTRRRASASAGGGRRPSGAGRG